MNITPSGLPNGIDDRGGDESRTLLGDGLMRSRAQLDQPVVRGLHVVDRPVGDGAALLLGRRPDVAAIEDAEFVAVVADPELDVGERSAELLAEVRLDAEDGGVPVRRGGDVVGRVGDGGESAKHGSTPFRSSILVRGSDTARASAQAAAAALLTAATRSRGDPCHGAP